MVQKEDLRRTVFVHRLEQLVVLGNVTLTNPALTLLCREGVDTLFLTRGGRYKGRLEGAEGKNVFLDLCRDGGEDAQGEGQGHERVDQHRRSMPGGA